MRSIVLTLFLLVALPALASPAAAATCKWPKHFTPNGAPTSWAPGGMFWQCVSPPNLRPPHTHPPLSLPCNGQTKRGPA